MSRLRVQRILCFLIAAAMPTLPCADPSGTLHGLITDEVGRPIAGARIQVTGRGAVGVLHASTDASGAYRLPGLPSRETLRVRAESSGRIPVVYDGVVAAEGHGTRRDFRLRPAGARETLIVLDPRIPYHQTALDGLRGTLAAGSRVLALSGGRDDGSRLRAAVRERPNAVVAIGSDAARLARRWVKDVPVVYTMVMDPAAEDLSTENLCGLVLNDGFGEQLARLAEMKPGVRRVATIYDPRRLSRVVGRLRQAAGQAGMTLAALPARRPADVPRALDALARHDPEAFVLLLDPDLIDVAVFETIRRFAADRGMVYIVPDTSLVAVGGTFSFAPGFREMGAYAGRLVNDIFRGEVEPADIGVDFPTTRYFSINPVEARRLSIPLPTPAD